MDRSRVNPVSAETMVRIKHPPEDIAVVGRVWLFLAHEVRVHGCGHVISEAY